MTRIRTGNARRRAKAARARFRGSLVSLDMETCGLDPWSGDALGAVVYSDGRTSRLRQIRADRPMPPIEDLVRTIDAFVSGTDGIAGLPSRFAPDPILLLHGDNAAPTSQAAMAERLAALTHGMGPVLFPNRAQSRADDAPSTFMPTRFHGARPMDIENALTEEERLMVEDTIAMFSKPDTGIDPGYAEWASRQPSYNEFIESLPDGLPGDRASS